jgi:hypothetical protein
MPPRVKSTSTQDGTEGGIGVLGMKPIGDHFILESMTVTPIEFLHYSMTLPASVFANSHPIQGDQGVVKCLTELFTPSL